MTVGSVPSLMAEDRVELLHQRMEAVGNELARLTLKHTAAVAARAAGANPWGTDLPPHFLVQLFELLKWDLSTPNQYWSSKSTGACAVMRATCATWCRIHDANYPRRLRLRLRRSVAIVEGKMRLFQRVSEVDLSMCDEDLVGGVLVEMRAMPSLRTLEIPASSTTSAVDAEALYGLTTLTTLSVNAEEMYDDEGDTILADAAGEWVLDLSKLATTLTSLDLKHTHLTAEAAQGLSSLTKLSTLHLDGCIRLTSAAMKPVSQLTALTTLSLSYCRNVETEGLRAVSRLTTLTSLSVAVNPNVDSEGLRSISALTALTSLNLASCQHVTARACAS